MFSFGQPAASGRSRHDVDGAASVRFCSSAHAQALAEVLGSYFLTLPVHARGALVVDLHAVHADVALPGSRIARDDAWERNEASTILRPAFQNGKVKQ